MTRQAGTEEWVRQVFPRNGEPLGRASSSNQPSSGAEGVVRERHVGRHRRRRQAQRERMAALERQAVAVSGADVGGSRSLPVRFHRSTVVSFASEGDYVVIRELGSTVRSNVNILPTVQHEVTFAQQLATLYPAGMTDEELSEDERFGEQLMAWHKETVE